MPQWYIFLHVEPIERERRERPRETRDRDPKCYQCGRYGHIARACENGNSERPARTYDREDRREDREFRGRRREEPRCYNCKKVGHMARECKFGRSFFMIDAKIDCYQCGKEGHIAKDCTGGIHIITQRRGLDAITAARKDTLLGTALLRETERKTPKTLNVSSVMKSVILPELAPVYFSLPRCGNVMIYLFPCS